MGDGGRPRSQDLREATTEARGPAFPIDTSAALLLLLRRYAKRKRPQTVSFRKLVFWLKVGERATHYVHPYPAKLLPQIAHFFLAADCLTPRVATVLDPFAGTGTVALEAILSGRSAVYADVNPLARLIARVKTTLLSRAEVERAALIVRSRFNRLRRPSHPDVVNIDYWFAPETKASLSLLRRAIDEVPSDRVREFFLITFSAITKKLSTADPRLSVPVRLKDASKHVYGKAEVIKAFEAQLASNLRRMDALADLLPNGTSVSVSCAGQDARQLLSDGSRSLSADTIDLVISSPPYAGAQKYVRASSLHLGWIGLVEAGQLADLERRSIGREHFSKKLIENCPTTTIREVNKLLKTIWDIDRTRALICATYISEMEAAIVEIVRVLKPGGHFVLVIGNNEVCGLPFKSSHYLQVLCERHGLRTRLRMVDEIKSRGLMTKRNRSAGVISREWVILFEKPLSESDRNDF